MNLAGGVAAGAWLPRGTGLAEESEIQAPLNRFPRMMQEYYVAKIAGLEKRELEKKAALKSKAEAEAYVREVREKIAKVFMPMPKKKVPLRPRITGMLDRDQYTVEKIIFQSRPKFYVTANLYLPKGRQGRVPGVVGTCGHSSNGKNAEAYQSFAQGLARQGTACLIYDPIGQGERWQYLDGEGRPLLKGPTREHNMAGNQMELVGEFLGSWRAWDGIRALDYLLSRPEIDSKRIGVTGNSGGGTMTTWLLGVEPRWTMGAPACFVTTWRHNMENELPQDNEQCPPGSLAMGLDHDDYLAAMAPKPVIILAKERDFFDVRGAEEVFGRLRRLYRLLGAEENIKLQIGPTTHGYSQENREAMYRFFNSITKVSQVQTEPDLQIEEDAALWCTPNGQVVADFDSRTVFDFTKAKAEKLKTARESMPLTGEALKTAVAASLRMPQRDARTPPRVRILRASGKSRNYPKKYWINYAVESEPRIQAVCTMLGDERLYSRPPRAGHENGRALLWIADESSDAELRDEALIRDLMEKEGDAVPVFTCDVRGVGESLPGTAGGNPHGYYGADYFYAAYGNMLRRPVLGGRTFDVLRVLDFMAVYGWTNVHLASRGKGCIPAGLAALIDHRVKSVTLKDKLESWHSIALDKDYEWPLSSMIFGVLKTWDLPDVWKEIGA